VTIRDYCLLDLTRLIGLQDRHANQPFDPAIAPSTQTSRHDPGKDRRSGNGTRANAWQYIPIGRGTRNEKAEAHDERGGQSENLGGSESKMGEEEGTKAHFQARSSHN